MRNHSAKLSAILNHYSCKYLTVTIVFTAANEESLCRAVCYPQPLQLQIISCYFSFYICQWGITLWNCLLSSIVTVANIKLLLKFLELPVSYHSPELSAILNHYSCKYQAVTLVFPSANEESLSGTVCYPQSLQLQISNCYFCFNSCQWGITLWNCLLSSIVTVANIKLLLLF